MTENEVATLVARDLGILDAVETLSGEDFAAISQKMGIALAELESAGLRIWAIDDTPEYLTQAFADYVKPLVAPMYGMARLDPWPAQQMARAKLFDLVDARRNRIYSMPEMY